MGGGAKWQGGGVSLLFSNSVGGGQNGKEAVFPCYLVIQCGGPNGKEAEFPVSIKIIVNYTGIISSWQ